MEMDHAALEALVVRQASAWQRADLAAISADFAEHGLFISPGGICVGPVAIQQAAQAFFQAAYAVQIQINRILIDRAGTQGAVEWTWSEVRDHDGQRVTMQDAIIFRVEGDKIVYWREYFDPAQRQPLS